MYSNDVHFKFKLSDLFIGRLAPHGNELEVMEVAERMNLLVNNLYPNLIPTADEYKLKGNGAKYNAKSLHPIPCDKSFQNDFVLSTGGSIDSNGLIISPGVSIVGETYLTNNANDLFSTLNINSELSEANKQAEFRSRLTYMAFNKTLKTKEEGKEYVKKMIFEFQHLSIVAGTRVNISLAGISPDIYNFISPIVAGQLGSIHKLIVSGDKESNYNSISALITLNLKDYHKLNKKIIAEVKSGFNGNEKSKAELLKVGEIIIRKLNEKYPEIIGGYKTYL